MTRDLKRILYVEDDEDIAEMAVMALEALGNFEVTHCSSGQAAISAYTKVSPQLVIMDVMMPEMDGLETIGRLKAIHGMSVAPFIYMTARAQQHEKTAYLETGALDVIVKPFDPMTLCEKIFTIWEQNDAA